MKYLIIIGLFSTLIFSCKEKEELLIPDLCPSCHSNIELNGINWPSKPHFAWFDVESEDTFFTMEIMESIPTHDEFNDALFFSHIPYEEGEYMLDSIIMKEWKTKGYLIVLEFEWGTPVQLYFPLLNGESHIKVEDIDKTTGAFRLSFFLNLYPNGDPYGEVTNSTYTELAVFSGSAEGIVTFE